MIHMEVVNRVNPKHSPHKENIFFEFNLSFFVFIVSYQGWMLAEPTVVIISQYIHQTIMLKAFNLHSNVCKLFLSNTGKI